MNDGQLAICVCISAGALSISLSISFAASHIAQALTNPKTAESGGEKEQESTK